VPEEGGMMSRGHEKGNFVKQESRTGVILSAERRVERLGEGRGQKKPWKRVRKKGLQIEETTRPP